MTLVVPLRVPGTVTEQWVSSTFKAMFAEAPSATNSVSLSPTCSTSSDSSVTVAPAQTEEEESVIGLSSLGIGALSPLQAETTDAATTTRKALPIGKDAKACLSRSPARNCIVRTLINRGIDKVTRGACTHYPQGSRRDRAPAREIRKETSRR